MQANIRNFSTIAHIDHGKTTLSDRLMERTGALTQREMTDHPVDADQYAELRDALEKLRLNDSSLFYEPETSAALGFGFRCGFLGLLHMEIVQERLEREFNLTLLITAPSVRYRVLQTDGQVVEIDSPARLPDPGKIASIEEPVITATILTGDEFVGGILKLCQDERGIQKGIHYI